MNDGPEESGLLRSEDAVFKKRSCIRLGRLGFTRTELLAVLAVLAAGTGLLALALPALARARLRGETMELMAHAKSIHMWFIPITDDGYLTTTSLWPAKGTRGARYNEYPDSTDYFRHLVTSGALNVSFEYFAAPGIPAAHTRNPGDFHAENNAWSVTAGLNDTTDEETPYFMLRNMEIDRLDEPLWDGTTLWIGSGKRDSRHLRPYGSKAFVFVTKGGAGFAFTGRRMRPEVITNLFQPGTNAGPILHPWPN